MNLTLGFAALIWPWPHQKETGLSTPGVSLPLIRLVIAVDDSRRQNPRNHAVPLDKVRGGGKIHN